MKMRFLCSLAVLALCSLSATNLYAKADAAEKTEKVAKELRPGFYPVQKSVKSLRFFNGRVNPKADYYIFLQSASWCPPCRAEMPEIAEQYLEMKKDGRVELILVSADMTKGAAKDFAEGNKAKFPVIMASDKKIGKLVGYKSADGIPHAIFVDKNGKMIKDGHGAIVKDWKNILFPES